MPGECSCKIHTTILHDNQRLERRQLSVFDSYSSIFEVNQTRLRGKLLAATMVIYRTAATAHQSFPPMPDFRTFDL